MSNKKQDDLTPIEITGPIPAGLIPSQAEVDRMKQEFFSQDWVRALLADCETNDDEQPE